MINLAELVIDIAGWDLSMPKRDILKVERTFDAYAHPIVRVILDDAEQPSYHVADDPPPDAA